MSSEYDDYDDYETLEKQYLERMKKIQILNAILPLGKVTENDKELSDFVYAVEDIYGTIHGKYKKAYKTKNPELMYVITRALNKWITHMDGLIEQFETDHPGQYMYMRKKKSSKAKPKRKVMKKKGCGCK